MLVFFLNTSQLTIHNTTQQTKRTAVLIIGGNCVGIINKNCPLTLPKIIMILFDYFFKYWAKALK